MQVDVLLVFDWHDGPLEGVLRSRGESACWYFKLIAERLETSTLDDRLFGLWPISGPDASILIDEFGDAPAGTHVWPAVGGMGSASAQRIVEDLPPVERTSPTLVLRTSDFSEVLDMWNAVKG